MGKSYIVAHQKVSISIGFNGKLYGFTELTIVPTASDLRTLWLNARHLNIISTALRVPTAIPLAFTYLPPSPPTLSEPGNIHTYPELKRNIWRATNEGEEGELGIALPQGCIVKVPHTTATPIGLTPAGGATPGGGAESKRQQVTEDEWEQIVIAIEYEVVKPGAGIVIVSPDDANPSRFPHVFTSALSDIGARTWVPCSDHARDRCTWDLELTAPRDLSALLASSRPNHTRKQLRRKERFDNYDGDAELEDDEDEEEADEDALNDTSEEWPVTLVASGELIEQVVHPDRSDRVIWHYVQATPVSVQQIGWAMGPFVVTEVAGALNQKRSQDETADDEGEDQADEDYTQYDDGPKLHSLCLPGREAEMEFSIRIVRQAMEYYTATFGSYPFSSYTLVFIDSLASGSPTFHSAAMTLFSSDMLHPASIIDQAYETRQLLAHALAVQWSGINLIPKTPSDTWLVVGIALHITSLFLKTIWGNNEYRFRMKKDIIRCVGIDVQREPISVPARLTQPEPAQLQFIALKAPLVLHILDKYLRKSGTSLGLDKVLPKLFLDAITGDVGTSSNSSSSLSYNSLSTTSFMRICRKACGGSAESLKIFFDQWVYGSGCPTFIITALFNRKRMAVELSIKQECLAYNWSQSAPWEETGHLRAIPLFDGQMTIRIHEADGTPYEHVLNIQEPFKRHEVPFNTKYKRIRRNTKRYQARQAAATAAASGDAEAQEDVALIDVGFSLKDWEDEKEREKWRVADWSEEDDMIMSQATYEWIRIDADMDWIAGIQFEQPDFMWLSQLQRDRDVVAQLEAVHALSRLPSPIVSSNLTKTVLVENYFIRIRMEAALALVACATKAQEYLGLFQLFKLFQTKYCFEPEVLTQDPFGFRCIAKTNDFRDMSEYFLKKTILTAISMVRDEKGQAPSVVHQFLVDLLAYNDNLGNPMSDTFYLTSVIAALGHSFVAVSLQESGQFTSEDSFLEEVNNNAFLEPAVAEIDRYMSADRLVPSYHNAITVAGIEWKVKMTMACLIPEDRMSLFVYTRDGNYPAVRIAAFDGLLLLNPLADVMPLVRYFFAVMREDSSRLVQRRLAQGLLESLPILAAIHDLAAPEIVFEEDGAQRKDKDSLSNTLKALRKKPGRSLNYRQCLLQTLTHPDVDPEVRLCVLKVCEATVRPEGEPLPKMRFRVPIAATESPATLASSTPTPKFKIMNSSQTAALPKIMIPRTNSQPSVADISRLQPFVQIPQRKAKVKAPAKLEPSQASGMSLMDVASCKNLIRKLLKDKNSNLFKAPVDPVKSGAPGYFDIVKNPMDISTMNAKLLAGQYPDRHAFRDDFKLIIANAVLYNVSGVVVDLAKKLDANFDKQWDRVEATLRTMETGQPAAEQSDTLKVKSKMPQVEEHSPVSLAPAISSSPANGSTLLKMKSAATTSNIASDSAPHGGFKITLAGLNSDPSPTVVKPSKNSKKSKGISFSEDNEQRSLSKSPQVVKENEMAPPKIKLKKPKDKTAPVIEAVLPPLPIRPEILDLPPLPPPATFVKDSDAVDFKKAKSVLAKMNALRESFFFQVPVEAVGPLVTYYDEIKHPMDLQTMNEKLDGGKYRSYSDLFSDFDLIVANCKQFNTPNTEPIWHALIMDRAWRNEWEKASKMPYNTKRAAVAFLKILMKDGAAFPFLESVDTIIDQIPTYYDIIPRGDARDLGNIRKNLEEDVYPTIEALEADVALMLRNCFTFNAPENQVYKSGQELSKLFAAGMAKVRAENNKVHKRAGDKVGGVQKKQKV